MTQRINYQEQSPELFKKLVDLNNAINAGVIAQGVGPGQGKSGIRGQA